MVEAGGEVLAEAVARVGLAQKARAGRLRDSSRSRMAATRIGSFWWSMRLTAASRIEESARSAKG